MPTAYYSASLQEFLDTSPESVVGTLATNSEFPIDPTRRDAWLREIDLLRDAVRNVQGTIFLEFIVPRIGTRIDAVVIAGSVIFVLEFKVGEHEFQRSDLNQAWDYALDLKNFHSGSHHAPIIPILVATEATTSDSTLLPGHRSLRAADNRAVRRALERSEGR